MERLQAFKYRLKTNPQQERELSRIVGACRWVFNKGLESCQAEGRLKYAELCKRLTGWRKEFEWLKDAPSACLQQSLKNLENAWKRYDQDQRKQWLKDDQKCGEPTFRKKGNTTRSDSASLKLAQTGCLSLR